MKNKYAAFSAIIFLMLAFNSCQQNKSTESKINITSGTVLPVKMDDSSQIIIDRAIMYAGGYEAWQKKATISFDKKSISYDSTGKVSRELNQHLDYVMKPEFKAKITYMLHDTAITLIHDGQKACKSYNGKISHEQKDIDGAWNSCFGSQFVMCMPFKLKDPGIIATYVGQLTLADGVQAQVVKTTYIKGAGSNPSHIWYYYFEPSTGKLLANSLNGKDNYWDYTRYENFETVNGLLLPTKRKSYTANDLNKPGKLISESVHTNIVLDKEFSENYFKTNDGN